MADPRTLGIAGRMGWPVAYSCAPETAEAARRRRNGTVAGLGPLLEQARPAFCARFGAIPGIALSRRRAVAAPV